MPDHPPIHISVVTPVHNEEACIEELVRRADTVLGCLGWTYEIIVVSDGSSDRTEPILRQLTRHYAPLRGIFLSRNMGQGNALACGIRHSLGHYVVVMDGDLQNPPEEIPRLLSEMDKGYALVSATRADRPESWLLRRLPSRVANWMLRRVTGCAVRDMGGFKCMRGDIARSLRLRAGCHRLLPALVHLRGGLTGEVEVRSAPRFGGRSHYGISRSVDVFFDILLLWFQASFQARPLYLFGRIGLLLIMADCLIMPWLLWDKFVNGVDMGTRPPFLVAIMFFLAALFIFAAGFTLELVSDTLNTVSKVDPYIVREEVSGERSRQAYSTASASTPSGMALRKSRP